MRRNLITLLNIMLSSGEVSVPLILRQSYLPVGHEINNQLVNKQGDLQIEGPTN